MFGVTANFTGTPTFTPAVSGTPVQLPDAATRSINRAGSSQRIAVDGRNGNVILKGTSTANSHNFYAYPSDFSTRTNAGNIADGVFELIVQGGFAWKIDHSNSFSIDRSSALLPDTSTAYTAATLNNTGFNTVYYTIPASVVPRPTFVQGIDNAVSTSPVAGPNNEAFFPLRGGTFIRVPDTTMSADNNNLNRDNNLVGDGTAQIIAAGEDGFSTTPLTQRVFYRIA